MTGRLVRVNVCRDPALVADACLRVRVGHVELYAWRYGLRILRGDQ